MITHDPINPDDLNAVRERDNVVGKLNLKEELSDIAWLMGSRRGRRIVWRLLDNAGVFRSTFHTNAMTMAFNEGKRNEGLRWIAQIQSACPSLYQTMVEEQASDRNSNRDT